MVMTNASFLNGMVFRVPINGTRLKSWQDLNVVFGCLRTGKSGNQFAGSQGIRSGAGFVSGHL
jgi:hypothetical protein